MPPENEETFVKITNKDIYNELKAFKIQERKHFEQITSRQDVTNCKVKLAKWIGSTALGICLIIVGLLIEHIASTGKP